MFIGKKINSRFLECRSLFSLFTISLEAVDCFFSFLFPLFFPLPPSWRTFISVRLENRWLFTENTIYTGSIFFFFFFFFFAKQTFLYVNSEIREKGRKILQLKENIIVEG